MKKGILIIGGYGDVGKYVVKELLSLSYTDLVVGGRDSARGCKFINDCGYPIEFLEVNIYEPITYFDKLDRFDMLIMCLSSKNIDFALYCLNNHISYIDISPSNQIVRQLKNYNAVCQDNELSCVLGVGITPGLSTLFVKEMTKNIDSFRQTHISLLLGLGEEHGVDGVRWLLDHLAEDFEWFKNGQLEPISPFQSRIQTHFPKPLGQHSAFTFNLSDQQIVSENLMHNNVSTFLCYNSRLITWLVFFFKKIGFFKLMRHPVVKKKAYGFAHCLVKMVKPFYSDSYSIKVDILSSKGDLIKSGSILGNNNAELTGKIAAYTATRLISKQKAHGVHYLCDIFDFNDIEKKYGNLFTFEIN